MVAAESQRALESNEILLMSEVSRMGDGPLLCFGVQGRECYHLGLSGKAQKVLRHSKEDFLALENDVGWRNRSHWGRTVSLSQAEIRICGLLLTFKWFRSISNWDSRRGYVQLSII